MEEDSKWDQVNLDEVLAEALAKKEALLTKIPRLRSLQDEIDNNLSPDQSLAEKFYTMGVAHARYHGSPGS